MIGKLLTEHHLEFLSLTGGCTGSPETRHVKCHIVENHMSRLKYLLHNILDGWLRMGLHPPLGNFADISYLVEN